MVMRKLIFLFVLLFATHVAHAAANIIKPYLKIPLCISLGSSCHPALNLRALKLKLETYPFDWILSPFDSLYKALQDDFKYFLSDLKVRPEGNGVVDYYGFHFPHD